MAGIFSNYLDSEYLAELSKQLEDYDLEDPAIYDVNSSSSLLTLELDSYIIANVVALILAVACLIGTLLGSRQGMTFGVFCLKNLHLILTSSLLIGLPSIKRIIHEDIDAFDLALSQQNYAISYRMLMSGMVLYSLIFFNDLLNVLFCYELYRCVCKLETRENPLASILKKSLAAVVVHTVLYLVATICFDQFSAQVSTFAAFRRITAYTNFQAPWTVLIFAFIMYLIVHIVRSLIKNMNFRNQNAGSPSKSKPIYLISLLAMMAFCAFLQAIPCVMDVGLVWYYGDASTFDECFDLKVEKKEAPFKCIIVGDDQELYQGTISVFVQFPVLFLHAGKNYVATLKSLFSP